MLLKYPLKKHNICRTFLRVVIVAMFLCADARYIAPSASSTKQFYVPVDVSTVKECEEDPEIVPGLFQGDILLPDDLLVAQERVGLRWDIFPDKLWKNLTVPYVISPLYNSQDYGTILKAIRILKFMTCIRFVPWDGKTPDYIIIYSNKTKRGCYSSIGRRGGAQGLNLQPPDEYSDHCLGNEGRAIHELMHALGIFHEQARDDRDKYVKIHWDNIRDGNFKNFKKKSLDNTTYFFSYDYDSIMHYGKFHFTKKECVSTITPLDSMRIIGQRDGLSKTDCLKINHLYGCLDDPGMLKKYNRICKFYGL